MHVNPFMLLGGGLRGTLPNPQVITDEASLMISSQVFGRRSSTSVDLTAQADRIVEMRAFTQHLPRTPQVQAGTGVTITENALGPVISATGGATPETLVEGVRSFLPREVATAGGPHFAVQFNQAGALFGDAEFTYQPRVAIFGEWPTLTIGTRFNFGIITAPDGCSLNISAGGSATGTGGNLTLFGGAAPAAGQAGSVRLEAAGGTIGFNGDVVLATAFADRITLDGNLPAGDGAVKFNDYTAGVITSDASGVLSPMSFGSLADSMRAFLPHVDPRALLSYENSWRITQTFESDPTAGAPRGAQIIVRSKTGNTARIEVRDVNATVDRQRFAMLTGSGVWGIQHFDDAGTTLRNVLTATAAGVAGVPSISGMAYGPSQDNPLHTFNGAHSKSYTPGSFSLLTGRYECIVKELQLTGAQRVSLAGTARLRVIN